MRLGHLLEVQMQAKALDGGDGLALCPSHFSPVGKVPITDRVGVRWSPRTDLDVMVVKRNMSTPARLQTLIIQSSS